MANPKVARATAKRFMTQALLEADTFVAEGRAKDVDMGHLRELKENVVTSCNTYIDSIPQDEITEEIENDLANYFSKQCTVYSKVVLEINKSVSAAKDVKPNVNVDAASAISREEIAAMLTVKQGSLSYDGAALEYYNFIIRHKQAVKFIKDPSTKLSILLDSLTGRAAMIIGGCSFLGDDGYEEALDLLKEQFGNKENIFGLIEKDLLEGKQVKSADQLLTFACVLRSAVTSMKIMQKEKDLTQRMISEIVERRLSKGLQGRWRKYALDKKNKHDHYPSFESFVEWIERASRDALDPFYGFSDAPKNSASVHNASLAESHTFEPRAPGSSRSSESRAAESRSNVSFVTRQLVKRLGLHERPASLEIATTAGVENRRTSTECGKEAESESVRKSIMNSFYVDDWLQSADSEEEVQELVSGVRSCLKGGGFRLCKMTGSAEIVNCIPDKKETEPGQIIGCCVGFCY